MKVLTPEERDIAQHLKASLWTAVCRMVDDQLKELGSVTVTPSFSAALVELVYNQVLSLGQDLESFARHAKRKVIMPEDLYMVTRRNDMLTTLLKEHLLGLEENAAENGRKERATEGDDVVEGDPLEEQREQEADDDEEDEDDQDDLGDLDDDLDEILSDADTDNHRTENKHLKPGNRGRKQPKDSNLKSKVKTEVKEESDLDQVIGEDSFDDIDDEELVNLT